MPTILYEQVTVGELMKDLREELFKLTQEIPNAIFDENCDSKKLTTVFTAILTLNGRVRELKTQAMGIVTVKQIQKEMKES